MVALVDEDYGAAGDDAVGSGVDDSLGVGAVAGAQDEEAAGGRTLFACEAILNSREILMGSRNE